MCLKRRLQLQQQHLEMLIWLNLLHFLRLKGELLIDMLNSTNVCISPSEMSQYSEEDDLLPDIIKNGSSFAAQKHDSDR